MDFSQLGVSDCKKVVKQFTETVNQLNAKDEPNEVLSLLESKVATFKSKIPCIEYLRTPQLKDRHWMQIEQIAGDDISQGVTLEFIEDRGVFEKAMDIKKVFSLTIMFYPCPPGLRQSEGRRETGGSDDPPRGEMGEMFDQNRAQDGLQHHRGLRPHLDPHLREH